MDLSKAILTAVTEEKKPVAPATEPELEAFGTYGGTTDVKLKAAYLSKKGLIGADQLMNDKPDLSTREGITNSQADWKTSAISKMLIQARRFGLKTPTEIAANRDALMSTLDPRIKDALKNPTFAQIHPNYWQVFDSILKDQYANEASTPLNPSAAIKSLTIK